MNKLATNDNGTPTLATAATAVTNPPLMPPLPSPHAPVANADECIAALERALETADVGEDVYIGILRHIAAYVPYVMTVICKTLTGKTITIAGLPCGARLRDIDDRVYKKEGVCLGHGITYVFAGRVPCAECRLADYYDICNEATLHIVLSKARKHAGPWCRHPGGPVWD